MPAIIDSLNLISKTIDNLMQFLSEDKILSKDFEQYLENNKIEVKTQNEFNNVVIHYLLDLKMQNGLKVLEYYRRNNAVQDEIIRALDNSLCAVFQVNKILSNGFEVKCLNSNTDLTLIPMVKMEHLKTIGRYDYIEARILELDNTLYILEIYNVISEFDQWGAIVNSVKNLIQNPKSAYFKNEQKEIELKQCVEEFYQKFLECFKKEYISTTNKKVDCLIEYFNQFRLNKTQDSYEDLIEETEQYKYFEVNELKCSDSRFLENAVSGFSSHSEIYDISLWIDKKRGLYIIPFLKTFLKCFKEEIEGKKECIKEFLTSDKIPPSVIKYVYDNNDKGCFFKTINEALDTNFSTLEEVLFNTKSSFVEGGIYSPATILFNSELFDKMLSFSEKNEQKPQKIGRNDPCPCGSGLKYKNCCLKKEL